MRREIITAENLGIDKDPMWGTLATNGSSRKMFGVIGKTMYKVTDYKGEILIETEDIEEALSVFNNG